MERLSKSSLSEFLARHPFSVVHVDAEWDGYRKAVADKIRNVEPQYEQSVSFGYVDCDAEQDYAKDIGVRNVPSIAYYSGMKLFGVVIGIRQDIAANIERLMRGELLDETNILSIANPEGCIAAERAGVGAENTSDEVARGASKYTPS